jgi:hypothetical protein
MGANERAKGIPYPRILAFLLAVWLLIGCSANNGFPSDAQEMLDESARAYYTSPWLGSTTFEELNKVEIMNAWRAKGQENGEMWCVELAVSGRQADIPKTISAIWIVIQQDDQSAWQAAALETISASTTIERCGL